MIMPIGASDLGRVELKPYFSLTERQLRSADGGLFIAESPKVIDAALDAGLRPVSMLTEERHISGDAAHIIARCPEMPVFTGDREVLSSLTGYVLTRGVLCAMRRPAETSPEEICRDKRRIVVIDSVCDTTNIGAIFRSAAALGMEAVLLTRTSCDPLNRRAVRVSMGTVFKIPWTWVDDAVAGPRALGFTTVAMALSDDSVSLRDFSPAPSARLALILGTEGDGLSQRVVDDADVTLRIPMSAGVDSLNVAAASAVAFYALAVS